MKNVFIGPLNNIDDVKQLDAWRKNYTLGDLEIPHDFNTPDGAVETAVATKDGELICSLTGLHSIVLDPFIKRPGASPSDLLMALIKLETALTYKAQQRFGATDAYIAVPIAESKYIRLLQNYGWQTTVQNCVVLRRALRPDTVPLIGPQRDAQEAAARQAEQVKLDSGQNNDFSDPPELPYNPNSD